MYLLDTNIVSELRKPRPHGAVVAWLQSTEDADLHLSAVTLGEIQAGIEVTRDQDAAKAAEIEAWLELVAQSYNVLPMDGATFRIWARLMHRRSDTLYVFPGCIEMPDRVPKQRNLRSNVGCPTLALAPPKPPVEPHGLISLTL
jgi:predicted nucleic acid-binding protein